MRLLLKISGGTFYHIQTENSALLRRIDSKPLTDRIYVFEYSIFVTKNIRTPVGLIKSNIFEKQNLSQIHASFNPI